MSWDEKDKRPNQISPNQHLLHISMQLPCHFSQQGGCLTLWKPVHWYKILFHTLDLTRFFLLLITNAVDSQHLGWENLGCSFKQHTWLAVMFHFYLSFRWPLHCVLSECYQWPVVRVWWSVCNRGPWDGCAECRGVCSLLQVRHVQLTLNGRPTWFLFIY